jgi:signal transduction histidine kinase
VGEMMPRAKELGIEISKVFSPSLSEIWGDYNKIKEVFVNLVGNSFKFTAKGGKVTITLNQKDNFIETSISDTGAGIKKEDLSKLFQKFAMLEASKQKDKSVQGSGLGLYLSKLIVELHGGKIWAESDGEGKGAKFTFSLKVATPVL